MYTGAKELRLYVQKNTRPTLNEFVATHSSLIDGSQHTLKELINLWKTRFSNAVKKYKPALRVDQLIIIDYTVWNQFKTEAVGESRSLLFQWYHLLQEKSDFLDTFLNQNSEQIELIRNNTEDNVQVFLQKLSISLFDRFDSLTSVELNVLKMSLSYIVDIIDNDMLAVYKRFIPQQYFQLWQEDEVEISVEAAEEVIITSVVEEFLRHFSDSTKAAKKYILGQQLELIDDEGTTKAKVINLLNQVIMLIERKDRGIQEADYVSFVKQLLLFVFEDTPLSVLIGETGAKCTIDVQKYNSDSFSGAANSTYNSSMPSSSHSASRDTTALTSSEKCNIFPRKIDLRILGEDQQELAFSEFKSHYAKKLLIQYQESKSLRLNHCIIKSNRLQQPVISINWEGWNGTMFQIVDCGGFCLAKKCAELLIPSDRRLVDSSLKNLVVSLFFWKSKLCSLNDFIFRNNNKAGSKRKHYEGMPHTLLSPKHR